MFTEWQNNQPTELTCVAKYHETADTISLRFVKAGQTQNFDFKPGQFVSLGIEIDGKVEYRAYSISSLPNDTYLQLTVKRVEGGKVSNYLIDQFNVDDSAQFLAPTGEFNSVDHQPNTTQVLLVSAGCGITPVFSMAKTWLSQNADIEINFLHVAKSAEKTIYFKELEALAEQHSNFNLLLLLKDNTGTDYPQGRLDLAWLERLVPNVQAQTVYLCGPTLFMEHVQSYVTTLGLPSAQFYQESFTPVLPEASVLSEAIPTSGDAEVNSAESSVVNVFVPAFGKEIEAEKNAVLADVLESAGLPVIIACRSGMCGSCKCKVEKGSVTMHTQHVLSEDQVSQGYVLACSSTVQDDVEVTLNP